MGMDMNSDTDIGKDITLENALLVCSMGMGCTQEIAHSGSLIGMYMCAGSGLSPPAHVHTYVKSHVQANARDQCDNI